HRSDLYNELRRVALGQEGIGRPAKLHAGQKALACDPNAGTVTLASGELIHADVILGAEGIGSVTRTAIIGRVQKAPYLGWCCFRALFDASKLKDIPELAWITEGVSGGKFVAPKDEPFRALFLNLCRDGTVINLVALYVDPEKDDSKWTPTASREEVLEHFRGFHPNFLRLLEQPSKNAYLRWRLVALPELEAWTRGRAAILGDAAHATFPSLGQGAAIAIEEAGVLGCLLPLGTKREEVPARLKAYETLCKPRGDFLSVESEQQTTDPSKRGRFFGCE
ncbi:hypothetical protein C8J57DRAFT_1651221, partial [Mycena rebaudengoi]